MSLPFPIAKRLGNKGNRAFFQFVQDNRNDNIEITKAAANSDTKTRRHDAPPTLVQAIMQSGIPASEKAVDRLCEDVMTATGGGFEASRLRPPRCDSSSITCTATRRSESACGPSSLYQGSMSRAGQHFSQLPYLTAVLYEGLRLSPSLATRMARVAPNRDLFYAQWRIPAGTPVGMTTILMHLNEELDPDVKRFAPERWVDADVRKKADKTFAPLSRGSRSCLGMQ
jgi:cytochrome P450